MESHFPISVKNASLLSPFEAVGRLGVPEEVLFGTFMPESDFLTCWGQQFKVFGGAIVVNPHLPAIVKRYTPSTNVFAVVVRARDGSPDFFSSLNKAIYDELTSRGETPVLHAETLEPLAWPERVRRTYHISRTHLMALFDMANFVYLASGRGLDAAATPLGRELIRRGAVTRERLEELRENPLVYTRGATPSLHYLPLSCMGQGVDAAAALLRSL